MAEGVTRILVILEIIKGHAFICCLLFSIRPYYAGEIA
jgi:hypothetical protein